MPLLTAALLAVLPAAEISSDVAAVKAGDDRAAVAAALADLSAVPAGELTAVLGEFDGADAVAANLLRTAVQAAAGRMGSLPTGELRAFVADRDGDPRARQLAYELLAEAEPSAAELLPGFLDDTSPGLRTLAVADALERAEKIEGSDPEAYRTAVRRAFAAAVDPGQIRDLGRRLKKIDEPADLDRQFGFLTDWHVVGPFDHAGGVGWDKVYPPEETPGEVDLDAHFAGKLGPVVWEPVALDPGDEGKLDVADRFENWKGSLVYLTATLDAERERPVRLKLTTPNGWKLWLNGEQLFARDEYHRGTHFDQYEVPAVLEAGENRLLLKLLQNEQEEGWAQRYEVIVRVTDPVGVAVANQKPKDVR